MVMVCLKNIDEAKPEEIAALANNRAIANNLRDVFPHPYTLEDALAFQEMVRKGALGHVFGIFDGDAFVGVGGVVPQQDIFRINGEIGYWIGEPYWGKGYATQVVKQLTAFAFNKLDLLRVYACVFEYNKTSMRVLEKAGFALEAVIKSSILKNNQVLDEYLYSIRNV